jgi:hypothetical protein
MPASPTPGLGRVLTRWQVLPCGGSCRTGHAGCGGSTTATPSTGPPGLGLRHQDGPHVPGHRLDRRQGNHRPACAPVRSRSLLGFYHAVP